MITPVTLITAAAALLLVGAVAALLALPNHLRRRRQQSVRLQIALTDALDEALGPVVAPVVTRPPLDAYRIEMAMPPGQSATTGQVIGLIRRTLLAEGIHPPDVRVVLTARLDGANRTPASPRARSTARWADSRAAL
mgnify:CR=1 FL=1